MYLLPNEAMELLQITTRQGLHKVVVNHNITVKSQGAGKPNLYLKSDLERYKKDNAKNIEKKKNPQVIEKAEKVKKEKVERKVKAKKLKVETKKELKIYKNPDNTGNFTEKKTVLEDENLFDDEDIIKPKLLDFNMKDLLNEIGQNEFDRVVELLKENGTYKEQDRALVLTYAVSFQNWVFATVASAKQDNTTSDQFGNLKLHPYMVVSDKCLTQMTKIASILGIGIRNRIGIQIEEKKKESIFDILNSKESFDD